MSILHKMKKAAQAGFHVAARVMRSPTPEEAAVIGQQYMRTRTLKKAQVQKAIGLLAESSDRYHMTEMSAKDALNTRANQLMNDPQRRAIYSVNSYLNIFGIPRPNFWKLDNDRLARNAIYAVCEKRIMDTIETIEWDVTDHEKKTVDSAVRFLKRPNPQDTFQTLIKQTIPDVLRYDQAVWVKTRAIDDHLLEIKAYSGPEFWIEVDNKFDEIQGQYGLQYYGPWSHGYVKRYWQHSRPGIYIPFAVRDICMIMMYKRADSIYGTDFLQQLKWQLEALIDSTKAAGMTFANGVGPSLWWKHPDLSSIEQLEERNMEVELENKGPENAGNILHLLGQEEVGTIFPSLLDLQWLDGQKFLSSIVWAMFGFAESEFNSSDVNRATAYINGNITKSKMLAPLLRHFETVINTEILPELEGYQEGWTFAFKPVQELDDKLKEVQVEQGRADVLGKLVALNVPLEEAMRIAKYEEEQITAVTTSVNTVNQQENSSMEAAYQNLLQANGLPPDQKIGNQPPGNNQTDTPIDSAQAPVLPPDQGGMPHAEKYTGQVRNDSGKPEDDGEPGKKRPPFEKADFREEDHPRADDGKFGDKNTGTSGSDSSDDGGESEKVSKPKSSFTPAKTRDEAEKFAKDQFIDPVHLKSMEEWNARGPAYKQYAIVSYRGVDLEIANKINAELLNQKDKGLPLFSQITTTQLKKEPGIIAHIAGNKLEFNTLAMGNSARLQKDFEMQKQFYGEEGKELIKELKSKKDRLSPRDQKFVDTAEKRMRYSREMVGGTIEATVQHESFHNFARGWQITDDAERKAMKEELQRVTRVSLDSEYKYKISAYGGETIFVPEEHAAEAYVAYNLGEYENIHPEMLKFFRKWFK